MSFSSALTILVVVLSVSTSRLSIYTYKLMEIMDDLPVKSDLEKYLSALEKIVYFADGHRSYVDLNLCIGIYLINVNLRSIVLLRGHLLPFHKHVRLEHMIKTNDDIIRYFSKMSKEHIALKLQMNQESPTGILSLYSSKTSWPKRMQKFNTELLKSTKFYSRRQLEGIYHNWSKYTKNVMQSFITPSPEESDHCIRLLAQNPINYYSMVTHCHVPYYCTELVLNGTDYGYGITHRLIFLLAARYWRGCVVMPQANDEQIINTLCAKAYSEIEYLANHDFGVADLVIEQIALCSMEGHTQFMRRSWLEDLVDFQTTLGCFNETRSSDGVVVSISDNVSWEYYILDYRICEGSCNVHTTGMAAAMLAAVVRFIIENYY